MSLASRLCVFVPAFVACVAVAGCGDSYGGRLAVSGTVTLVGQPIKDGSINFFPQDGQGTETGCPIIAGKFQLARKDGLRPGKYLIRVTAGDGKTPTADEGGGPGGNTNIVSVDLIPSDWAEASQQYVEVKQGDKNEFTLAIPKTRPVGKKR